MLIVDHAPEIVLTHARLNALGIDAIIPTFGNPAVEAPRTRPSD
jgi:hypothetical protein